MGYINREITKEYLLILFKIKKNSLNLNGSKSLYVADQIYYIAWFLQPLIDFTVEG